MTGKHADGRVVIVADDVGLRNQLKALITRAGYRVEVARTVASARRAIGRPAPPCLVIVDALMNGADELAHEIALRAGCAVCTVPVRLERQDGRVAKRAGPLEPLLTMVNDHCRRRMTVVS
jgi:DNA-binding response OmpR family regulator